MNPPPTLFHQAWTLEVVQQIKLEYENAEWSFLCLASPTFKALWDEFRPEIRALARAWKPNAVTLGSCLFMLTIDNDEQIRLNFLNHCISLLQCPTPSSKTSSLSSSPEDS